MKIYTEVSVSLDVPSLTLMNNLLSIRPNYYNPESEKGKTEPARTSAVELLAQPLPKVLGVDLGLGVDVVDGPMGVLGVGQRRQALGQGGLERLEGLDDEVRGDAGLGQALLALLPVGRLDLELAAQEAQRHVRDVHSAAMRPKRRRWVRFWCCAGVKVDLFWRRGGQGSASRIRMRLRELFSGAE